MVRLCAFALVLMTVDGACAQSWPSRPIRAIVPYTAGGAIDIVSRTVAQQLSLQLGYPIVIESRPGAGGVTPSANIRSAQALVAAARARPGGLNYASGGSGSATHLNAERFRLSAGFEGVHVPFKGGPEALAEVMSGRVDFVFSPILPSLPFIREGKAVALGVSTSKRASALPDVPTTLEAGFANSDYNFWVGVFVPAKTSRDVVDRLHRETVKVLQSPEIQTKLSSFGADPMLMQPTEFDTYVRNEIAANETLVKAAGLAAK